MMMMMMRRRRRRKPRVVIEAPKFVGGELQASRFAYIAPKDQILPLK